MKRYYLILVGLFVFALPAMADELRTHKVKLEKGGHVEMEVPVSWGNRSIVEKTEAVTHLRFAPFGTPVEPIFSVSVVVGVTEEGLDAAGVRAIAEQIREEFKESALETDLQITDLAGDTNVISYFTMTDKEIKPREYQYLTAAAASDGKLAASFYFFSNDSAPDYGADAMHLMQTIRYVPPEPSKKRR